MSRVLVIFVDGLGLGPGDPDLNPLAVARMPATAALLEGRRLVAGSAPFVGVRATLLAIDARLGVEGTPQSATGQAALLTGRNVPALVGEHYGPKPNRAVSTILRQDNLFMQIRSRGGTAALLNAYPPGYFEAIDSGRRLYSSIPMAVVAAGIPLKTAQDLQAGEAFSVDFTGQGWSDQPGFPPAPIYSVEEAGRKLAELSQSYDLAWFDYWLSDVLGHRGSLREAVAILESLDAVLGATIGNWGDRPDLIVLTSDHGNLENLGQRGHTMNPVPALVIGPTEARNRFCEELQDLTSIAPAILRAVFG